MPQVIQVCSKLHMLPKVQAPLLFHWRQSSGPEDPTGHARCFPLVLPLEVDLPAGRHHRTCPLFSPLFFGWRWISRPEDPTGCACCLPPCCSIGGRSPGRKTPQGVPAVSPYLFHWGWISRPEDLTRCACCLPPHYSAGGRVPGWNTPQGITTVHHLIPVLGHDAAAWYPAQPAVNHATGQETGGCCLCPTENLLLPGACC